MKKMLSTLLAGAILFLSACGSNAPAPAAADVTPETSAVTENPDSQETADTQESASLPENADSTQAAEGAVIGIAWRADPDSEFFTNICRSVEAAGGTWVMLDQVFSPDLPYDDQGRLTAGVAETGALDESSAKYLRCNTWRGSNAADAVQDVSAVLFTGGEDISPTLYYVPEEWHGIEEERDYNAERDVSDYLTMTYCLDQDIPMMGFCRGMQMLAVVSGGEVIQDIPTYFDGLSLDYQYEHRNQKATPDSYRDYAPHTVEVDPDSLLYDMVGTATLSGCPSWHHQAAKSVENTRLVVTGTTETEGIPMIEAIERTDKTFAVGVQFHPEAALVKNLDDAENKADYLDHDTALSVFQYLVQGRFASGGYAAENAA